MVILIGIGVLLLIMAIFGFIYYKKKNKIFEAVPKVVEMTNNDDDDIEQGNHRSSSVTPAYSTGSGGGEEKVGLKSGAMSTQNIVEGDETDTQESEDSDAHSHDNQ